MQADKKNLPLVYACSGCSSAAQMANHIALQLDRQGMAEMSCIAGVGGDVPSLLKTAQSGRPIVVLDGCPLACAKHCLERHGIMPSRHHQLQEYGVKKHLHADFDAQQAQAVITVIKLSLALDGLLAATNAVSAASADAVASDLISRCISSPSPPAPLPLQSPLPSPPAPRAHK